MPAQGSLTAKQAEFLEGFTLCYDDPLRFVVGMYPWGQSGTFLHDSTGPDEWQEDALALLGEQIRARMDPGHALSSAIRLAIASGHGVGKTALMSWLIHWFTATRPTPQVVVTANTKTQLSSKTWRELNKWHQASLIADWFKWEATTFRFKGQPNLWYASAIPWSKSNAQAFAGTHERHVLMLFDEASNIDDIIWETVEGAMTTQGAMWVAVGNPIMNTGRFRECWTRFRRRWITFQVDARRARMADKRQISEWIEDYGIDSDFVRTRVLGEFPKAGPLQMIPVDLVDAAVARDIDWKHIPETTPRLMGVDVARSGENKTVVMLRQGPKVLKDIFKYRIKDLMQVAARVAHHINNYRPDVCFVDATGMGAGVVDRLVQLGFDNVVAVYTGNRGDVRDRLVYYNPRIESWARLKAWLATADIPDDRELREDLIAPEYFFDTNNLMRLEPKEDLLSRGIPSPDCADALALTFAQPVPVARRLEAAQGAIEPDEA